MSGSWAHNDITSTVGAKIGAYNTIVSKDVSVSATSNERKNILGAGQYNVQAGAGGVFNLNAAESVTNIANHTTSVLGHHSNVSVVGRHQQPRGVPV